MLTITFYGHACFALTDGETKLLIDPFFTGNGLAPIKAEEAEADYILVTHGHGDHTGDAASIAERTGATIITTVDVGTALFGNCRNLICGNIGGKIQLPFGSIQYVPAIHGSGVPGGVACGFVIRMDGKTVYHMGDTSLTKDFELLADQIDALLIPIGDFYTMGPEDALTAVEMIRPGYVIPMHFNTFPMIMQDADSFARSVEEKDFQAQVLNPGEFLILV
jgi:L-ascorbate metabolism protein UlaG (beta-lactamase superfamily)